MWLLLELCSSLGSFNGVMCFVYCDVSDKHSVCFQLPSARKTSCPSASSRNCDQPNDIKLPYITDILSPIPHLSKHVKQFSHSEQQTVISCGTVQ